jgi:hypothetical protein
MKIDSEVESILPCIALLSGNDIIPRKAGIPYPGTVRDIDIECGRDTRLSGVQTVAHALGLP